jgi:hypothetical protein
MKHVKINPDCFKRHYPPHRPWYLMPDYESLQLGITELIWFVTEGEYDCFTVIGFLSGDSLIELKPGYNIQKGDCTIIENPLLHL